MIQGHTFIFQSFLTAFRYSGADIFVVNKLNHTISLKSLSKPNHCIRTIRLICFHRLVAVVLFLQGLYTFRIIQASTKNEVYFPYIMQTMFHIYFHYALRTNYFCRKTICSYVNGLLEFPNKFGEFATSYRRRKLSLLSTLGIWLVYLTLPTVIFFPFGFLYLLHWQNPCTPTIVLSILLPQCYHETIQPSIPRHILETFLKMVIFVINHWALTIGLLAPIINSMCIGVLGTITISEYLKMYDNLQKP